MQYIKHRTYDKYIKTYVKNEDAYQGQEQIKAKSETYLPKLPAMALDRNAGQVLYDKYISGALWFPATSQTVAGYLGIMFRKQPQIEVPEELSFVNERITDDAQPINLLARQLAKEVVVKYRPAVLVDYPEVNTDGMTVADIEALNLKPYAILYSSTDIVHWHEKVVNGIKTLDKVIIHEKHDVENYIDNRAIRDLGKLLKVEDGQFNILRVLKMTEIDGRSAYVQELYIQLDKSRRENKDKDEWIFLSSKVPIMNGDYLSYIPIVPCSQDGLKFDLDYALINDLVNVNIADYNNDALYRDNLLFLGRPTPCFKGLVVPEGEDNSYVALGSSSFLEFDKDGGEAWLLGGDSSQSAALKEAGNDLKKQLATIGLRSLAADPAGVETATTAIIHRSGEHGILSSISNSISACLTKVLKIMGDWMAIPTDDISYKVSTDFIPAEIDPQLLNTLWTMYVSGGLPLTSFLAKLKQGEIVDEAMTEEEFKDKVNESRPVEVVDPVMSDKEKAIRNDG